MKGFYGFGKEKKTVEKKQEDVAWIDARMLDASQSPLWMQQMQKQGTMSTINIQGTTSTISDQKNTPTNIQENAPTNIQENTPINTHENTESLRDLKEEHDQEKEQKKREFNDLVNCQQSESVQQAPETAVSEKRYDTFKDIGEIFESKKRLQQELAECSKTIRDIQRTVKETYQFQPCRHLCELLVNIRQNVYRNVEDIQEDLRYVIEAFGINEFEPSEGNIFDARCHDQVYSHVQDARGKKIDRVYSTGFVMDGEVILKAQVSVKE